MKKRDNAKRNREARERDKIAGGWQRAAGVKRMPKHETRLCLRPERIPGIAPPCEDDRPDWRTERRISLPQLDCLKD